MKEEEFKDRDKVLHEIGRGYIEMKHNRSRGYMVLLDDTTDKMEVMVYNMSQEEFLQYTIRLVEDTFSEMEDDDER
jgi:uncharacterized protein